MGPPRGRKARPQYTFFQGKGQKGPKNRPVRRRKPPERGLFRALKDRAAPREKLFSKILENLLRRKKLSGIIISDVRGGLKKNQNFGCLFLCPLKIAALPSRPSATFSWCRTYSSMENKDARHLLLRPPSSGSFSIHSGNLSIHSHAEAALLLTGGQSSLTSCQKNGRPCAPGAHSGSARQDCSRFRYIGDTWGKPGVDTAIRNHL